MSIDINNIRQRLERLMRHAGDTDYAAQVIPDSLVLVAEVERLREMLLNAGWPREAEELAALALRYERAAVVAWLRAEAEAFAGTRTEQGVQRAKSLTLAAGRIERGEHRREETK